MKFRAPETGNVLFGIALALSANAVFSTQDAVVKWLVADFAVLQVLFTRSLVIAIICALVYRRTAITGLAKSRNKPALALRAGAMIVAWLCYYSAARSLALADLVTLYYSSPLIITVMSIFILGERVSWARWLAVIVGFAGVVVAANPAGRPDLLPALLVLVAATLWAWANILMRQISASESTQVQMLFTGVAFVVVSAPALPWIWVISRPVHRGADDRHRRRRRARPVPDVRERPPCTGFGCGALLIHVARLGLPLGLGDLARHSGADGGRRRRPDSAGQPDHRCLGMAECQGPAQSQRE